MYKGFSGNGGNHIYILGPKFRIYYFAHLNSTNTTFLELVETHQHIGTIGNSGNAMSKPYHLHFSVFSLMPIFKSYGIGEPYGLLKMFYLDPNKLLITD